VLDQCSIEWTDTFYSEEFLKQVAYGGYSPGCFEHLCKDGVYGAIVREGVCPIHGVTMSMLGGIPNLHKERHPCGAYKTEDEIVSQMQKMIPCPGSGCAHFVKEPRFGERVQCSGCGLWIEGKQKSLLAGMQVKETPEYKRLMGAVIDPDPGDVHGATASKIVTKICPTCGAVFGEEIR
jgi:hypothetical protein